MASKEKKTLTQKIDSLITDFEENKQKAKRDRVLSKIDGLYNLFITVSVFIVGLIISQNRAVTANIEILFVLLGIIITLIFSYDRN
jgi:uncharacterized membrane protein